MRRFCTPLALIVLLGGGAPPARAETLPWPPLRDATLHATVTTTRPGQPPSVVDETLSVQQQTGDTRRAVLADGYVVLTEVSVGRQYVLFPADHRATEIIPDNLMDRVDVALRARLTAQGTKGARDEVAGIGCTEWNFEMDDVVIERCLDDDNVALRVRRTLPGGAGVDFAATSVSVAPLDPGLFRLPPDATMTPPAPSLDAAIASEHAMAAQPRINPP